MARPQDEEPLVWFRRVPGEVCKTRIGWLRSWLYPELAMFPREEDRDLAARKVSAIVHSRPGFRIRAVAVIGALVGVRWVADELNVFPGAIGAVVLWLLCFVGAAICAVGIVWPVGEIRRMLRQSLCECGVPTCIRCGYNLKDNLSGRCPECGTPIKPLENGQSRGEPGP